MDSPFAQTGKEAAKQRALQHAQEFGARKESLTRLVKNPDFRAWFSYVSLELCAADFGTHLLDEEAQGRREAMSFLRQSIADADGGPEFIGQLTANHFKAIAESRQRSALADQPKEKQP